MTPVVSAGLDHGPDGIDTFARAAVVSAPRTIRLGLSPCSAATATPSARQWGAADRRDPRRPRATRARAPPTPASPIGDREPPGFHQRRAGGILRGGRRRASASPSTPATPSRSAEAPLDFARTAIAPDVGHVHLKDYRVQFTDEGYRLVRCAIGDGAVPFREIFDLHARRRHAIADRRRWSPARWRRGTSGCSPRTGGAAMRRRTPRAGRLPARRAGQSAAGGCRLPHAVGARAPDDGARSPTSST